MQICRTADSFEADRQRGPRRVRPALEVDPWHAEAALVAALVERQVKTHPHKEALTKSATGAACHRSQPGLFAATLTESAGPAPQPAAQHDTEEPLCTDPTRSRWGRSGVF